MDLSAAIDQGDGSIGLPPYNGGLFDSARTPLLDKIRLSDGVLADVIDGLSYHVMPDGQRRYINYRDLSVQQLGSIYERLLEYEIVHEAGRLVSGPTYSLARSRAATLPLMIWSISLSRETLEPLISD